MGFFDNLVMPEEPDAERTVLIRLGPPAENEGRYAPPLDHFAPALLPGTEVVGVSPEARVLLTGWSVWPRSVTMHLAVFRKTRWQSGDTNRQSGLRVGLRFSDGRRITTLDIPESRYVPVTRGPGLETMAMTSQAVGLMPLDAGGHASHRSLFRTAVDLYAAELPPSGETQLVVEWPDEGMGETRTLIDTAAIRAAAEQAFEVWPGLEPQDPAGQPSGTFTVLEMSGPPSFLAPPLSPRQLEERRREEEARRRYLPRADWTGMGYRDWGDAALIKARLDGGASPDAPVQQGGTRPLHLAASWGKAETVAALLAHGAEADAHDEEGHTPLWYAACGVDEGMVRALIEAGADVWTPQEEPWSPGRLLLTTPLAPLVTELPGAVSLPAEEVAALRAADALIAAFSEQGLWTEGLGIAFVAGVGEDEVVRRLGGDPALYPAVDEENMPFDPMDYDASLRYVGVTGVDGSPGGCVIVQDGYMPSDDALLRAVSAGTSAYGVYFNPKGGTFGALARDGGIVASEEIGLSPQATDPAAYWTFRFWQRGSTLAHGADVLAYACATAGMTVGDGRVVVSRDAARRWVPLPPALQR
ncbi:ankyrin repeat domain-containing protein [Streptomyces cyaneofuscatus]|uniref:ankyrin repeat domain-containing protein n=1 Tax=Streptomyces cyaneofuscatus TaxID=66883 RepID=UPI003316D056